MTNVTPLPFKIDIVPGIPDQLQLALLGLAPILASVGPVWVALPDVSEWIEDVFTEAKRAIYTPGQAVDAQLRDTDIGWVIGRAQPPNRQFDSILLPKLPPFNWGNDPLNEWIDTYCGKPNRYRDWAMMVLPQITASGRELVAPTDASRYYEEQLVTGVVLNRWINARHRL